MQFIHLKHSQLKHLIHIHYSAFNDKGFLPSASKISPIGGKNISVNALQLYPVGTVPQCHLALL